MQRLKEWREQRGHSLRQLAEISGVHFVSLARMESGLLDPRLSTLLRITKALGITLNDLMDQTTATKGGKHHGSHTAKR
jgi:transcriptional regulator with XRE-family HTH domain